VKTLITVTVPPEYAVAGDSAGFETATMARLEMARADWLARSIGDFVTKVDRSSGRDHERLVSLLINHEMALRSAERSEAEGALQSDRAANDRGPDPSEAIRAARAARAETTRRAGLQQDLAAASVYLGTSTSDGARPLVGVPDAHAPDRIRRFGRPFALMGSLAGVDETAPKRSLTIEPRLWQEDANRARGQAIAGLAVLLGLVVVATAWRPSFLGHVPALAMALAYAGYTGGPLALAAGLGLVAAGWRRGRE
jgi:hypothetical protein